MRTLAPILAALPMWAVVPQPPDADGIMAQVVANVERRTDARRQFVYEQKVRSHLVRPSGQVTRRERREYTVLPGAEKTEKTMTLFHGEYRDKKGNMIAYAEKGFEYKDMDIDGELIEELTDDLVDDKGSRDGIPHGLFPLRPKDLDRYKFAWKGETKLAGRPAYRIGFEPVNRKTCLDFEGDDCSTGQWTGEIWVDAEDLQPQRIVTTLGLKVPWAIRVFLGTNIRQTGFSVTYARVAPDVWFPATYGTEFKLNAVFFYKRTIALSMESSGFRRADAVSSIRYDVPE